MAGVRARYRAAAVVAAMLVAGCSESTPTDVDPGANTLTVDASTEWAYVDLDATASQVSVAERSTSTDWDIAFNATRVMLNGGAAGPGSVVGYCICANANASAEAIQAMTPDSELAAFESVTLADVPADEQAWTSDALDAAIQGWYSYDMTSHQVAAAPEKVWEVRGAGEDPEYAKVHVIEISDATQAGARVTLEYAVQPGAGEPLGEVQTAVLDGRTAPVYFDFETGVSDAQSWDIQLSGYDIRINGGISGEGGAGAVLTSESFEAITDASDTPANHYRGDAFGGVFVAHPWYRYNLDGNHTIFPTYDVYLIDDGETVYKLQIIGYYSTTGESRHITFRAEPLGGQVD